MNTIRNENEAGALDDDATRRRQLKLRRRRRREEAPPDEDEEEDELGATDDDATRRRQLKLRRRRRREEAPPDEYEDEDEEAQDELPVAVPVRPRTAVQPVNAAEYAARLNERRRSILRRLTLRLAVFVLLPTLLAGLYYGLVATPRYVSEAQMTIHAAESGAAQATFAMLLTGASSGATKEIHILETYVTSLPLLEHLQARLDLRRHYSQEQVDRLSRLAPDATQEEFLKYYQGVVETLVDLDAGALLVRAEAFSPEFAQALVQEIVRQCENLLNSMADKARQDMMAFARGELVTAEERLRRARLALMQFRTEQGDLDPVQAASSLASIIASIEGQLTTARVERTQMGAFMRGDSARMTEIDTRIKGLEQQLADMRRRLTGSAGAAVPSAAYTEVLNAYGELVIEEEFARQAYESAARAVEIARAEAARKHGYVVDFLPPSQPDAPTRPERLLKTATVMGVALLVYLLGSFVIGALREHARI